MRAQVEGDKWELYIPASLGYGDKGMAPLIPPAATLVFVMEILKINGPTVLFTTCACSCVRAHIHTPVMAHVYNVCVRVCLFLPV